MLVLHLLLISLTLFHFPIQIEGDNYLLSYYGPAEQSSTLNDSVATFATDYSHRRISQTKISKDPWWQSNLYRLARVRYVTIVIPREDLNNFDEFTVLMSNYSDQSFTECTSWNKNTTDYRNQKIFLNCQRLVTLKTNCVARFIRIKLLTADTEKSLRLCQAMVMGNSISGTVLLSESMHTEQISTLNDSVASLAVDGNTKSDTEYCSHTGKSRNPWWQVYLLLGLARISHLRIYVPPEYVNSWSGLKVMVSNSTYQGFSECAFLNQTTKEYDDLYLLCFAVGRIVRIQLTADTEEYLSLCEVKVYGDWIWKSELLSEGMPASQSSTNSDCRSGLNYYAFLAVDGDYDAYYPRRSCSLTRRCGRHWWQVYLPGIARVWMVSIYPKGKMTSLNLMVSTSTEDNFTKCGFWNPLTTYYPKHMHLKCDAEATIVRIQLINETDKDMILCKVEVYGDWIEKQHLLSEGMPTSQSSTLYDGYFRLVANASLAVDGNTNKRWQKKSCSLTDLTIKPWWQVNLKELARITIVSVHSRVNTLTQALSQFNLLVSNSTDGPFLPCASGIQPTTDGQIIGVKCDAVARIVRIQLVADWEEYLSLCEVQVYGYSIGD